MADALARLDPRAAEIIEHGIHSHELWRDFLKGDPTYPTNDVGNVAKHEKWIANYEYLKGVLVKALSPIQTPGGDDGNQG